jgi:predicted membrane metal-binding protein
MAYFRGRLQRALVVCLVIFASFGALFALALLATAVMGNLTPSSILLAGFGFILLALSVLVLVFAIRRWTPPKPGRDS